MKTLLVSGILLAAVSVFGQSQEYEVYCPTPQRCYVRPRVIYLSTPSKSQAIQNYLDQMQAQRERQRQEELAAQQQEFLRQQTVLLQQIAARQQPIQQQPVQQQPVQQQPTQQQIAPASATSLFDQYRMMQADERQRFLALVLQNDSSQGRGNVTPTAATTTSETYAPSVRAPSKILDESFPATKPTPVTDPDHDARCKSLGDVWGEYVSSKPLSDADRERLEQETASAAKDEATHRGATHSRWRSTISTSEQVKSTLSIWKCVDSN